MPLSTEQKNVVSLAVKAIKEDDPVLRISGRAGTGKSFCLIALKNKYPRFAVGAYTGKAASVLRRRGIHDASTIHRLIYTPVEEGKKIRFVLKSRNEIVDKYDGFLIDEGGMVTDAIYSHLLSFGLPLIFFGDEGQLEPINSDFNLMANPDISLEKIHRNAGEIAHFAEWLREGKDPRKFPCGDKVAVTKRRLLTPDHYVGTDQVICAFNKTRCRINGIVRERMGFNSELNPGEKVICLRNNSLLGVYNGQQGIAREVNLDATRTFRFSTDEDSFFVRYEPQQFGKESGTVDCDMEICLFDYAYAITAHKSIADEFGNVIVLEEICEKWDHKRWAYTAASRAKTNLIWATQW